NATSTSNNTAFGSAAMNGLTVGSLTISGNNNAAFGYSALQNYITGSNNAVFGMLAMANATSSGNSVAIGYQAGRGYSNADVYTGLTALGYQTGLNLQTGSDYNTLLGYQSGYDITTGNNNLILGTEQTTNTGITTGSYNIVIGNGYYGLGSTTNNQLNIGNLLFSNNVGTGNTLATGNLGIGTSTPYSKLTVWGTDTASTSPFAVVNSASTTVLAAYDNGTVTYSGLLYQASDRRLKTNIASLDASTTLSLVNQLNPVSYTRIDQPSQGTTLGFLAQEVQKLFPSLVTITDATPLTPDGTLTLNYTGLIAPMVKAIQEVTSIGGAFQQNLIAWLGSASNGIGDFFAAAGNFGKVSTHQICLDKSDGSTKCHTADEIDQALT